MLVGISDTLDMCAGKAHGEIMNYTCKKFVIDQPDEDTGRYNVMQPWTIGLIVLSAGSYTALRTFAHPPCYGMF